MLRKHTTHHDDCGCLRAKLEAERDALALRLAALQAALRDVQSHCSGHSDEFSRNVWATAACALSGDDDPLRSLLVEAFDAGVRVGEQGDRWDGKDDGNDYADRFFSGGGK